MVAIIATAAASASKRRGIGLDGVEDMITLPFQ
jgi:hypothetical protein